MLEPHVFGREYMPLSAMAPHEHETACLNIVVGGDFTERIGKNARDYRRGHAAFCPPGLTHSQTFGKKGARQVIINTKPEWVDYLKECKVALDDAPHVGAQSFAYAGDRLLAELNRSDTFSRFCCEGIVLETLAAFGRGWYAQRSSKRPPSWVEHAEQFIRANGLEEITIAAIASAVERHPIHLCREFRRYFGMSVAAYVRQIRIQEAARLLAASELGLSEIALECGFSSHSHLCCEFKRQLGLTPSQYRNSAGAP
jgi:AraC family transcriptional regulator